MAETIKGINVVIGAETTGLSAALSDVNKRSKDIQSELKQVDKLLKLDPKNTELLAQKQKLLADAVEAAKGKLDKLRGAQEQVEKQFKSGDIGEGKYRAFQREVANCEIDLKRLEDQLKISGNAMDTLADKAKVTGDKLKDIGQGISNMGGSLSVGLTAPLAGIFAVATEGTRELRQDLSKLETNAQAAGVSLEATQKALRDLNAITGETDSNVEALSNLFQAGFTKNNLQQALDALSGAVIKFPDTLKIEGLADGLQETLATGKAVGPFAELLDRMGVNADKFNSGLQRANKSGTEQKYILDTLAKTGLADVNKAYRDNNQALIDSANAQYDLKQAMSELGQTLEPILTAITEMAKDAIQWFNDLDPKIQDFIIIIAGLGALLGPFLMFVGTMASGLGTLIIAFGGAEAAAGTFGAVMTFVTGPVGLAIAAVAALAGIAYLIVDNWDSISKFFSDLGDSIKQAFDKMLATTGEFVKGIVEFFVGLPKKLGETGKNMIKSLWEGIKSMGTWILDKIKGFAKWIGDGFKAVFGFSASSDGSSTFSSPPGNNAGGTDFWRGGLTWTGENGPELARLPRGTQIFSHEDSMQLAGGVTQQISLNVDASNLQEVTNLVQLFRQLQQTARARG